MSRLKCKKCQNIFEQGIGGALMSVHLGPYHYMKCPACGQSSWFNVYSSVKEPVTYPSSDKKSDQTVERPLSEEELEKKQIEDSKYERS
jgi:hypothetical protein